MDNIDFDKILNDACWRLPNGVIDLKDESHLDILRKVLREYNIDNKIIDGALSSIKAKIKTDNKA